MVINGAMSKHETQMTRWYWQQVGGILIEEFPVLHRGSSWSHRLLDGLIIKNGDHKNRQTNGSFNRGERRYYCSNKKQQTWHVPYGANIIFYRASACSQAKKH